MMFVKLGGPFDAFCAFTIHRSWPKRGNRPQVHLALQIPRFAATDAAAYLAPTSPPNDMNILTCPNSRVTHPKKIPSKIDWTCHIEWS